MIFDSTYLDDKSKTYFIEYFFNDYMNPNNFELRHSVKGHYVLFINKNYYGMVKTGEDICKIGTDNDTRHCFRILGIPEKIYNKCDIDPNIC
jgi:hypothetical protein